MKGQGRKTFRTLPGCLLILVLLLSQLALQQMPPGQVAELFFTPSVEPFEIDPAATAVPMGQTTAKPGGYRTGEIFENKEDLPSLGTVHGGGRYGWAQIQGRDDVYLLWTTLDGTTRYLIISADNPAFLGIRDPETEGTLEEGFYHLVKE